MKHSCEMNWFIFSGLSQDNVLYRSLGKKIEFLKYESIPF